MIGHCEMAHQDASDNPVGGDGDRNSMQTNTPPEAKDPKAERMREILTAALAEFYEEGFAAARLDSIAERAGVAKGTIYLYVSSKEALFEEAARNAVLPVLEDIEGAARRPSGPAEELLRQTLRTFYRRVIATDRRRLMRLLISEGPRFPKLLEFYHREIVSRAMAALTGIVHYGVDRGEFRAGPALEYPQIIVGPALAGAIWTILFGEIDPIDLDGLCDAHLEVLLNGLSAKPGA